MKSKPKKMISADLAPIFQTHHCPNHRKLTFFNFEDPNKSCTWYRYWDLFTFEGLEQFPNVSDARKRCVELGKNKCNGVHQCSRCVNTFTAVLISGLLDEDFVIEGTGPIDGYSTWLIGDCSMWQKWPSYYKYGRSYNGETHLSLAAA